MAQTNQNGESTYLVLESLADGQKYGLEIIEHITNRTGGGYIMKKPTLYSSLTRMEKKGLVSSSYWGESDMGGKRHYYALTDAGRQFLDELSVEFANANFENGEYSYEEESPKQSTQNSPEIAEKEEQTTEEPQKTVVLQQENLFNLAQPPQKQEEEKKSQQNAAIENQIDFFSFTQEENKQDAQKEADNGIFLDDSERITTGEQEKIDYYQNKLGQQPATYPQSNEDTLTAAQEEQNRRLYDTSSEFNKYRKRKSFSENQIEMAVEYDNEDEEAQRKQRIDELKKSLLSSRANFDEMKEEKELSQNPSQESNLFTETSDAKPLFTSQTNSSTTQQSEAENAPEIESSSKDDAVFITSRIEEHEIPVQRKIAPTNIDIDVSDDNLPAPKRNANLEPTYKDMMSKLFERKKEKEVAPQIVEEEPQEEVDSFADYESLKRYYKSHGIEFKEHTKSNVERVHNTNFLNFISSVILLCLCGIGSALIYWIVSATANLSASSNFLYYTVPILFFVYAIFTFLRYKLFASKKASLMYGSVVCWAIFVLACVVVLVINVIAGMQYEIMGTYLTSLLLPALAVLLAVPINYYIKKLLYKKYAK